MRAMKDSGIEWIGDIPHSWNVKRIKAVLKERNEINRPAKTNFILSLTNDRGVIPYEQKGDVGNKSKDNVEDYKIAHENDIVLNSMNVIIGSVGLSRYHGCVSPVYYMLYKRNKEDDIRFYNYLFQSKELQNRLKGYGNGIMEIRMRIQMSKLNTVNIPVAPTTEQHKIADYLDAKCSRIDTIVTKELEIITKLQEYKLSLITEKVTKGLESSVEKKDSGIEWIGKIPKHWKVIKLKYTAKMKGRIGWQGLKASEFRDEGAYLITGTDFVNGKIDFNRSYHISMERYNEAPEIQVKVGDLLITKDGTIGKLAYIDRLPGVASLNSHLLLIRPVNEAFSNRFLFWLLSSGVFQKYAVDSQNGSIMASITQEKMSNFSAYFPTIQEQELIADYLDKKCACIDAAITKKQVLIEKFTEYKKSLIYEVVTGKKEV